MRYALRPYYLFDKDLIQSKYVLPRENTFRFFVRSNKVINFTDNVPAEW